MARLDCSSECSAVMLSGRFAGRSPSKPLALRSPATRDRIGLANGETVWVDTVEGDLN